MCGLVQRGYYRNVQQHSSGPLGDNAFHNPQCLKIFSITASCGGSIKDNNFHFAAALIYQPEVLVVDEPMVGLDPHSIRLVKDLLRNYADQGKTVLMSTHTLSVAEEIADRVAVMKTGQLIFEGQVEELRSQVPAGGDSLESLYLALMEADGA